MNRLARLTAKKAQVIRDWENEIRAELSKEGASLRKVAEVAGVSHERVRQIGEANDRNRVT